MSVFDLDFYSAWDELDSLNEAAAGSRQSMTFDEVAGVLRKDGEYATARNKNKLRRIMLDMCKSKSGTWKTSPATWPYQLQLMYNAYVLENKAKELLNNKKNIDDYNTWLKSYNLQLAEGTWTFVDKEHDVLMNKPALTGVDLKLTEEDKNKLEVIKEVEVKGTTTRYTNAQNFHGAKIAIIFVFEKGTKSWVTPYLTIINEEIGKPVAAKGLQKENVDCIEIKVHTPRYPTVDNLDINFGLINIPAAEGGGEVVQDPTKGEQIDN